MSPSPAQSGHSSVTSEADRNGVLGGSASKRNSGSAESPALLSTDCHIALFCAQVILEERTMTNAQRDYVKWRLMQILFDVKYKD